MDPTQPTSQNPIQDINREFEEREAQERAKEWNFEYLDLSRYPLNPDILKLLPEEKVLQAELLPFFRSGHKLRVAIVNPANPETKKLANELKAQKYELTFYICSKGAFDQAIKFFRSEFMTKKTVETRTEFREKEESLEIQIQKFKALEQKISDIHAEKAINEIEILAVKNRASDIHFQPHEKGLTLRFRIDGILHNILEIDIKTGKQIINRIKYESGMKSNVFDIPQDGRMDFFANNRQIDLRVSTLPTEFLESVVMRLLDSRKGIRTFSELGFSSREEKVIKQNFEQKGGITLVTGPTGSGKTTTLYSMLAELNTPERKCVTLEDPIEYHLHGISQSPVSSQSEYTFSNGLKALLRHDPDVILVGEIREYSTAKLALEASLTGHTVLSSMHTNSSVGAIIRLRNLGLEDFNIAPTLNAIFAQRLVRTVCPHCGTKESLPQNERIQQAIVRLKEIFSDFTPPTEIPKAVGCEKCSHTGYMGQSAVCECFNPTDEMRRMIFEGKSEFELINYLREKTDFITMFEGGIYKVMNGKTTLDEVARVVNG